MDQHEHAAAPGVANTPEPPYYAVIFTSVRSNQDLQGYAITADRMVELARQQPGYLGVESVREGGTGVTVSYWRDLPSIRAWKAVAEHRMAQQHGRQKWYSAYTTRIARVERAYSFTSPADPPTTLDLPSHSSRVLVELPSRSCTPLKGRL